MKLTYTPDLIKGLVLMAISEYEENVENKNIQDVEVEQMGKDFKVKIWYPVSCSESDFKIFVVRFDHELKYIRQSVHEELVFINPFVESVII